MIFRKIYIILCFATIFSQWNLNALDRKELLATMEKISDANRALSKELSEWNKEKESLKLELSLIKVSIKDYSGNQEKLQKQIIELKNKKTLLLESLSLQQKLKVKIKSFLNSNSDFLLSASAKVPKSLKFIIKNDYERLKNYRADDSTETSEILAAINALTSSIVKAQKEVHKTKEVVSVNGSLQEVETLYLGTYTGYFRTVNGETVGRLLLKDANWSAVADAKIKGEITNLFKQFDKKAAPQLIKLPIGDEN